LAAAAEAEERAAVTTPRLAAVVLAAVLGGGCDAGGWTDVAAPVLVELSPLALRAGRVLTVRAENLELTPWDPGDVPPSDDEPDPRSPLPYELRVLVGDEPAGVLSINVGGATVRVPADLAPGSYPVRVVLEGRATETLPVEILPEPAIEIAIAPDPLHVAEGGRRPFEVYALLGDGSVALLDAAAAGAAAPPAVAVEIRDGRIARLDLATGEVVGVTPGATVLHAVLGTLVADAAVVVEPSR
jgi:hypothetical protein